MAAREWKKRRTMKTPAIYYNLWDICLSSIQMGMILMHRQALHAYECVTSSDALCSHKKRPKMRDKSNVTMNKCRGSACKCFFHREVSKMLCHATCVTFIRIYEEFQEYGHFPIFPSYESPHNDLQINACLCMIRFLDIYLDTYNFSHHDSSRNRRRSYFAQFWHFPFTLPHENALTHLYLVICGAI